MNDEAAHMKSLIERALKGDTDATPVLKELIIAPGAPEILWNLVMEES